MLAYFIFAFFLLSVSETLFHCIRLQDKTKKKLPRWCYEDADVVSIALFFASMLWCIAIPVAIVSYITYYMYINITKGENNGV